jgi:hypothetical protein
METFVQPGRLFPEAESGNPCICLSLRMTDASNAASDLLS